MSCWLLLTFYIPSLFIEKSLSAYYYFKYFKKVAVLQEVLFESIFSPSLYIFERERVVT